ncbi:MAG: class B sortase [Bacilli bacterium]
MTKKKKIILLIICILIVLVVLSLYLYKIKNNKNYYLNVDIEPNNNVNNPINYEDVINNLRKEYNNEDIKGILEIDNTDYIVPVLQGSDNDYYLNHDAYGNRSGMGSIYLDYRVDIDTSKKLLIYGHNSSNIDMPFKILEEFYDKDYYDNHKYVLLTTSTTKKRYEIFSVYVETSDFSYMDVNFVSDKDYLDHLTKLKEKSMYDTGVEVTSNDEILILQTCSTHKDYHNYQKKYLLIILRRV